MKIDNKNIGQAGLAQEIAGKAKTDKAGKTDKSGGAKGAGAAAEFFPGSSKVEVSDRAQMMAKAKAIAKNDDIDEAKVARLQKMIDDGKYQVSAEAIADKMVDEHLLMGE
jgi:negative regulator of flagellin synthesis FlgM